MLINDFSQQDFLQSPKNKKRTYILEIITASAIFLAPIIFLIVISS